MDVEQWEIHRYLAKRLHRIGMIQAPDAQAFSAMTVTQKTA
jgi:hypothetical protein